MNIRAARPGDADAIGRIRVNAWRSAYQKFLPPEYLAGLDPKANLEGLRSTLSLEQPPFSLKVAELSDEIVGFSILGKARHAAAPGTMEIWALNIDPQFWRKGAGRLLVQEALHGAMRAEAPSLELWCLRDNHRAAKLYEDCGFSRTAAERTTRELTGHPLHEVCYTHFL